MKRPRVFGVVITVPDALSRAADRVRRHYDPNFPRIGAHVTVLPPRPLPLTRGEVLAAVRRAAAASRPFACSLGGIRTFDPVMPVVYASLRRGRVSLRRLHARLARGSLCGAEAFPYVPHLTLGQKLDSARLRRAVALSERIFSSLEKDWTAGQLVVVERLTEELWLPLAPVPLNGGPAPAIRQRRPRRKTKARTR
ncbi:MAG TPA: 2'-5' RNA ligase family protein [Candidatus Polarisedimenticolia bacterium]|nr:2'-5' RNA ligase family protein [Candidatus Polarisedimenticolia bacterium]